MNDLVTKDVNFYGDMLQATQDVEGKIWVGISGVCRGIGLTEDQAKAQKKKIARDLILSKGASNKTLLTAGGEQNAACLQLEYLPIWLAKINITPSMRKSNPETTNKLVRYQLKAKDVLSDAFLKKNNQAQTITLQVPEQVDYLPYIANLEKKIDHLNNCIANISQAMGDIKSLDKRLAGIEKTAAITVPQFREQKTKTYQDWQKKIYELIDLVIFKSPGFKNRTQVLSYIYGYMTRTYGIVWDAETREFREKNKNVVYASKIEVVYAKGQLKSIFESVLADLSANTETAKPTETVSGPTLQEIIEPLANKNKCSMKRPGPVYRMVYTHMGVDWSQYPGDKKKIIRDTPELKNKFESTVKQLMKS